MSASPIASFPLPAVPGANPTSPVVLTWSPDCTAVLVRVRCPSAVNTFLVDARTGAVRWSLAVSDRGVSAFNPTNPSRILVVSYNETWMLDASDGRELWRSQHTGAAVSPDGRLVVVTNAGGNLFGGGGAVLDAETGEERFSFAGDFGWSIQPAFRSDSRHVAVPGAVFDTETGKKVWGSPGGGAVLAYERGDRRIVGVWDGEAWVVDAGTGERTSSAWLDDPPGIPFIEDYAYEFSPDRTLVAARGWGATAVFSVADGRRRAGPFQYQVPFLLDLQISNRFHPYQAAFASNAANGIVVHETATGQLLWERHGEWHPAFSTDGTRLAAVEYTDRGSARLTIYEASVGFRAFRHGDRVFAAALLLAGKERWVATACADKYVRLFNIDRSEEPLAEIGQDSVASTLLAFRRGGRSLVTGNSDNHVYCYELVIPQPGTVIPQAGWNVELPGTVKAASAASPDKLAIACADDHHRAFVFGEDGIKLAEFPHSWTVKAIAISADGTWLATGSDNTLRVVNTNTRQTVFERDLGADVNGLVFGPSDWLVVEQRTQVLVVHPLAGTITQVGPTLRVGAVALRPDGAVLAATFSDLVLRLTPLSAGTPGATRELSLTVAATRLAVGPSRLAVATNDNTLILLDATNLTAIWRVPHGGAITGLVFAADDSLLASASDDGYVRVFDGA